MSFLFELELRARLDRFELAVEWKTHQRFLGVFGPSGAGKTTLLRAIAGLSRGARGRIHVDGRAWLDSDRRVCLPPERRGVGYVPQDGLLFPHLDVLGNVLAGARRAVRPGVPRIDAEHVLEVLELGPLRRTKVANLSGGEKQRIALARALCSAPGLLLLDEPMASLDAPLRRRILPYLVRIREEFGIPTIHVSHDATETLVLSDEVLVLEEGRVVSQGRPSEVLSDPAGPLAMRDGGVQNVLRGRVAIDAPGSARLSVAPGFELVVPDAGLVAGREAIVSIPAVDVVLAAGQVHELSAQNDFPAVVREVRSVPAGHEGAGDCLVTVQTESGHRLVAAVTPRAVGRLKLAPEVRVRCIFKAHACRILGQV